MLILFTLMHLTVDGVCAAVLAAYATGEPYLDPILFYFGIYNLIAFGGQWLMGYLLDRWPRGITAALALTPACLGLGAVPALGIPAQTVLLGLGNCAFHVAAGSLVLRRYRTYKELGLFVSSGAIGLALGLNGLCGAWPFWAACAAGTAVALWRLPQYREAIPEEAPSNGREPDGAAGAVPWALGGAVILLLACVVLRGFGGGGGVPEYVMLLPCTFALGKALGGLCCDALGYRNTVRLIFALSFLALQWDGLLPLLLLTLAFNMSMPLTLRLLHWCAPGRPGLMFGLAAGCLLPGAFCREALSVAPQVMVVANFLGLFLAGWLLRRYGGLGERGDAL